MNGIRGPRLVSEALGTGNRSEIRGADRLPRSRVEAMNLNFRLFLLAFLTTIFICNNPIFSQTRVNTKLELAGRLFTNSDDTFSSDNGTVKHKSPGLAVLASLAVPGLGELYVGRYDVGKYPTIAEVSLWVFYTIMEVHSDQVRSDAINYAKIYAGAQVSGKPDQFFVDVGNFSNTSDYNTQKIENGENNLIYSSSSYQWQWESDVDRTKFKNLRIEADQFLNYGRYTAAVILMNHLISAIDAARLAAGVNASAATSLDGTQRTSGVYLKLAADF